MDMKRFFLYFNRQLLPWRWPGAEATGRGGMADMDDMDPRNDA